MRSAGLGSQRPWHDSGWRVTAAGERDRSPAASVASALKAFFSHCEADPECSRRHPDLERKFWKVFDRYEDHPTTAEYFDYYLDEPSKEDADSHFVLHKVLQSLRSDSWIPYLPFLLGRIAGGEDRVAWVFNRYRFERASIGHPWMAAAAVIAAGIAFLLVDGGGAAPVQHRRDHAPVVSNPSRLPWLHPMSRRPPCRDMIARSRTGYVRHELSP